MKKYLKLKLAIAILMLIGMTPCFAALELELTQGISSALPIAVVPFGNQPAGSPEQDIAKVVATDLKNSGRFRLVNGDPSQQPHDAATADFNYWKNSGAEGVVVGNIVPQGGGYTVTFQLLTPVGQSHILVNNQFNATSSDFRVLGHHIADLVYQKLTGERGIFSTRIAYIVVNHGANQHRLEIADADGYSPKALLTSSSPIMSPAWSPDGSRIAYVSFENKRSQIYVVDVATGSRRLITSFPGINGAPAWSPDGNRLAVVLSKDGSPHIYLAELGSGSLTQLTTGTGIDTEPSFSPDGRALIFTSDRGGSPQIYRLDLASKQISRITYDGDYNARAFYTADGKGIVMLHRVSGHYSIGIQDLGTGVIAPLTFSGDSESPSVAPNGKMVIYATNFQGRGVLSVVSTDGKVRLRLPAREGEVQEPSWSPFLG